MSEPRHLTHGFQMRRPGRLQRLVLPMAERTSSKVFGSQTSVVTHKSLLNLQSLMQSILMSLGSLAFWHAPFLKYFLLNSTYILVHIMVHIYIWQEWKTKEINYCELEHTIPSKRNQPVSGQRDPDQLGEIDMQTLSKKRVRTEPEMVQSGKCQSQSYLTV